MVVSENERIGIRRSLHRLEQYCAQRKYKGYDPYDVLNSKLGINRMGKWIPILAIQGFKRNPINLRQLIGVPKTWNPKALALFLNAYSNLPESSENREKSKWLFEKIIELKSETKLGAGWGYPFPWASPEKYLPRWSPTSVVSGFVVQGLDAYYRKYGDERALKLMEETCLFLSDSLYHTQDDDFYAISYSTVKPDFCYNASLLAAQSYALTFAHTGQQVYRDISIKALNTVLERQKSDGSWNYSEQIDSGKQRVQIDFHQGFILDSILSIAESISYFPEIVEKSLQEGFEFYRENQFATDGRALWRLPGNYPADIHHQAQGILTASRYYAYSKSRRASDMAKRVLMYTLNNFQDRKGCFYYRKHAYFTDRTSYMRWGNAWMFLALTTFLQVLDRADKEPEIFSAKPAEPV